MAEVTSRQVTALAGTSSGPGKVRPSDYYGKKRVVVIEPPATYAAPSVNDTIGSGMRLPAGARLLSNSVVNVIGAGAASSTLSIGLRNYDTKVATDATAVASAVSLTSVARLAANNGTSLTNGTLTAANQELYATFTGATGTANQQFRIEVEILTDD